MIGGKKVFSRSLHGWSKKSKTKREKRGKVSLISKVPLFDA
jgi:hypothetical protein